MKVREIDFSEKKVKCYFDNSVHELDEISSKEHSILLTDETVHSLYAEFFIGWRTIVIKSGEQNKQQSTIDEIIRQLIEYEIDKQTCLIGIGGGVITDIAGYVGSVYMRGIKTGFIPTTLLGMIDACIGGKNGIDVGNYKNMIGTITQPSFILIDFNFLNTLSEIEWANGFAEIIKHACIRDLEMFQNLELNSIEYYKKNPDKLSALVERNVLIKSTIVQSDVFENGERKLLNFGHTIGHAIERLYNMPHGYAVSIGMVYESIVSEKLIGFESAEKNRLEHLLKKYSLPVSGNFDKEKIILNISKDKKKIGEDISIVLLEGIGKGVIKNIPLSSLAQLINHL